MISTVEVLGYVLIYDGTNIHISKGDDKITFPGHGEDLQHVLDAITSLNTMAVKDANRRVDYTKKE